MVYRYFIITLTLMLLLCTSVALAEWKPPYTMVSVSGPVVASYFDGSRLWVVYTQSGLTYIEMFRVKDGNATSVWVSSVKGTALTVSIDSGFTMLAVATDAKKAVVFDISGTPVFKIDRGFRGLPIHVAIARRHIKPDTLIIVDAVGANRWVYAYAIDKPWFERGELWIPSVGLTTRFSIIESSSLREPLPYVAIARVVVQRVSVGGIEVRIPALQILIYEIVEGEDKLEFRLMLNKSFVAGLEAPKKPFAITTIDYLKVYSVRGRLIAVVGAKVAPVGKQRVPPIDALLVYDLYSGRSLVRYEDPVVGELDFYPLGGSVTCSSIDSRLTTLIVGSTDYNVYYLRMIGDVFRVVYSISLGAPVSRVAVDPYASFFVAGGEDGSLYSVRVKDGLVYWSVPSGASVTSVALHERYVAFGTISGVVVAFTNPAIRLYYLGIGMNVTGLPGYIRVAQVNISVEGLKTGVEEQLEVKAEELSLGKSFWLLPPDIYEIKVDHLVLGIYARRMNLTSNLILILQPNDFKLPYYRLRLCLYDPVRNAKPAGIGLLIVRVPWPGENKTFIESWHLRTDSLGCISIELPRAYYVINVTSWMYEPILRGIPRVLKLWSNLDLKGELQPKYSSVYVEVKLDYGLPVCNATVELIELGGQLVYRASTGGGGRALLPRVAYGDYVLRVSFEHAESFSTIVRVDEPSMRQTIVLKPDTYFVSFMAIDAESGKFITGYTVRIVRIYDGYTIDIRVPGFTKVAALPYGEYRVTFYAPGYHEYTEQILVDKSGLIVKGRLAPIYYTIEIEVRDRLYQRPLPAEITVSGEGYLYKLYAPKGIVRLQLRYGVYHVTVTSPYAKPGTRTISVPGVAHVIVELEPIYYVVRLHLVDAELGIPITKIAKEINVSLSCPDVGVIRFKRVGDYFEGKAPYAAACSLHVEAEGYTRFTRRLDVRRNMELRVEVPPLKYSVRIIVYSSYGIPLKFKALIEGGILHQRLEVKGAGSAVVELRPGNYTLIVEAPHHKQFKTGFEAREGLEIRAVLEPSIYTLSLKALDIDTGKFVRDVTAIVERIWPTRGKRVTLTLPGGIASIPLTWGVYRVYMEAPGYKGKSINVNLTKDMDVSVSLEPIKFMLEIKVLDWLTSKPIPNATVLLYGVEIPISYRALTDAKGVAAKSLRTGTYRIVISAPYHLVYSTQVLLINDTSLTVKLRPVNYTLRLIVLDGLTRKPLTVTWNLTAERVEGGFRKNFVLKGSEARLVLPFGTYKLTIVSQRYEQTSFTVKLFKDLVVKRAVPRKVFDIVIRVVDNRGNPVGNAIVRLINVETGRIMLTALTGPAGNVTAKVPWGTYVLEVQAGGYHPFSTQVIIEKEKQVVPAMLKMTFTKLFLDLLPAMIIASAIVGSAAWVAYRVRRKPVTLEILGEERE